ncbi:MAG: Rrf2 family transcriptional regulator [Deinococcales bacterium]
MDIARAQYGMRALVEVPSTVRDPPALNPLPMSSIFTQHYLEQIVAVLRKAGIVESIRGAQGGYRLAKKMQGITALEVVELMEERLLMACLEDEAACEHAGQCSTENLWQRVDQAREAGFV